MRSAIHVFSLRTIPRWGVSSERHIEPRFHRGRATLSTRSPRKATPSHFRRPVAGATARGVRASPGRRFAGAVSSREIRQRIARRDPDDLVPCLYAVDRDRPFEGAHRRLSTRARTLLDASASTAANLTAAAVPSDASDVESPPTSPDASTSSRPRLPTSTAEPKRAMLVDAMAKVEVTRPPPTRTTRRGDGTRSASSTPLGSDDDDTAKEDGGVLLLRRREGGWRRVLLLLPLFSPSSPTSRPCPPRESRPGRRTISTAPATKETEGRADAAEEDSRRDGFAAAGTTRFAIRFVRQVVVDAQLRRVFRRDGAATVQSASVRRGRE